MNTHAAYYLYISLTVFMVAEWLRYTDAAMYGFSTMMESSVSQMASSTVSDRRSLQEETFEQRLNKFMRQKEKSDDENTIDIVEQDDEDDTKYDYVTRSITDLGWFNPDAAIGNPFKGFMNYPEFSGNNPDIAENVINTSLESYYIGLDELMIGDNTFDWEPLERRLQDTSSRSRHVVMSIVCHYPNWNVLSVPQFIIDDGLKLLYYPDFLGGGHSPDYGDEKLLKALQQFITAFGKKYDGDQRIAFLHLGLLGFWGEWHTFPNDYVPDHAKQSVVSWYKTSFKTTKLMARYPLKAAYQAGFGLNDGSFTYETLDGKANGNETRPHYFWPSVISAKQTNFWKNAPMGGETRPEQQPIVFEPSYPRRTYQKQDFMECVRTTHATFLAHHDMFIENGYKDEELRNALRAHARLGYNFMITKVGAIFPDQVSEDANVQIDVEIEQVGVAPFYYPLSLFLDCPDLTSPIEINDIELLVDNGDSKVVSFRNVPYTPECMETVQFRLNSTDHTYGNRPIKFAQGEKGIVELRIPLPLSLSDEPTRTSDSERDLNLVYNLIDVNKNVDSTVAELQNGDTIDLAQVGNALTMLVDVYDGNIEFDTANLAVHFRFKGRGKYERNYPFLLAGHKDDIFTRSVYLSTVGDKTIRITVHDKRNKEVLLDKIVLLTVINSNNEVKEISQVSVTAPMLPRSLYAVEYLIPNTPSVTPILNIIPPSTNAKSVNSIEIHGFNTPCTPPLLILEERHKNMMFRLYVLIPIASAVVLALALLSCLVYRNKLQQRKRIRDCESVPCDVYKNPI